jgi:hypothetical protein
MLTVIYRQETIHLENQVSLTTFVSEKFKRLELHQPMMASP